MRAMQAFLRIFACTLLVWIVLSFTMIVTLAYPEFRHLSSGADLFKTVLRVIGQVAGVCAPLALLTALVCPAIHFLLPAWKTHRTWLAGLLTGPVAGLSWIGLMTTSFGGGGPVFRISVILTAISSLGGIVFSYSHAYLKHRAEAARKDPRKG